MRNAERITSRCVCACSAVMLLFFFFTASLIYGQESVGGIGADDQFSEILKQERTAPELESRPEVKYNAGSFRDPFSASDDSKQDIVQEAGSGQQDKGAFPSLDIQGLIWGGEFPQAIINNKVFKVGDEVDGMKITEIAKDGVTVLSGMETHKIPSPALTGMGNLENQYAVSKGGTYD